MRVAVVIVVESAILAPDEIVKLFLLRLFLPVIAFSLAVLCRGWRITGTAGWDRVDVDCQLIFLKLAGLRRR